MSYIMKALTEMALKGKSETLSFNKAMLEIVNHYSHCIFLSSQVKINTKKSVAL